MVAPEHLQGLLEVAGKEADDKQEGRYSCAVLQLLLGCAASAPTLFARMSQQVRTNSCVGKVCHTINYGVHVHLHA